MKVAFVLSGGGSLGAVQVGMVRALYGRGLRPDVWVGSSVGALNAVFLAAHPATLASVERLESLWREVRRGEIFPLRAMTGFFGFFGLRDHLVPAQPLRRFLEGVLDLDRLEQAPVPVHVVATELFTGRERLLSRGPAAEAVLASVALPGIFPPVRWGGELLGDGGVSNNTPIAQAWRLGARRIYVLPTGGACERLELPRGALGMLMHALSLLLMRHLMAEVERLRSVAELVVIPPPCPLSVLPTDFRHSDALMAAGEESASRHLDAVASGLAEPAAPFGAPELSSALLPMLNQQAPRPLLH